MNRKPQDLFYFLLLLCFSVFACQQAEKQPEATSDQPETEETQPAPNESISNEDMKIMEPDGEQMGIAQFSDGNAIELMSGSTEYELIKALYSKDLTAEKNFVINNVEFGSDNSSIIGEYAEFQIYNLAMIFKAFPEYSWTISSIVTDGDDSEKNRQNSELRLELFKKSMEEQGVDLNRLEFLPLGSDDPFVQEGDTKSETRLVLQVR